MGYERGFAKKLKALFRKQGGMIYDAVNSLKAARVISPSEEDGIILSVKRVLGETAAEWEVLLRAKIKGAMLLTGKKNNAGVVDLGAKIDLELFDKTATAVAKARTAKIQMEIDKTTLQRVSDRIALGIEKGNSVQQTAKDIRDYFDEMSLSRSELIAQVETGIAASRGDYENAKMTDLDLMKIWSNSQDDKVRESHQIREAVEMDELFSNGMLIPLWEEGPIEEIANCRCTVLYVPRDEVDSWL